MAELADLGFSAGRSVNAVDSAGIQTREIVRVRIFSAIVPKTLGIDGGAIREAAPKGNKQGCKPEALHTNPEKMIQEY